jgi:probable rRNA maturation factor
MSRRTVSAAPALVLSLTAEQGARFTPFLRRHLRAAHRILRPSLAELSVALVGDRRMAQLHQQFMGIPGPTDVLTFPLESGRDGRVTSGEVVVCVPEARRQAGPRGVRVEQELLLYALHGMLHLCGYDDRTDAAFKAMHRTEDRILAQLGVGPVFTPAPAPRRPRSAAISRAPRPSPRRAQRRATGAH